MKINVGLNKKVGQANYGSLAANCASSSRPTSRSSGTRRTSAAKSRGPTPPAPRPSTTNSPGSKANPQPTATGTMRTARHATKRHPMGTAAVATATRTGTAMARPAGPAPKNRRPTSGSSPDRSRDLVSAVSMPWRRKCSTSRWPASPASTLRGSSTR